MMYKYINWIELSGCKLFIGMDNYWQACNKMFPHVKNILDYQTREDFWISFQYLRHTHWQIRGH